MTRSHILAGIVVLLALALAVATMQLHVPYQYEPLGPKVFPLLLSAVLLIAALGLLRLDAVQTPLPLGRRELVLAGLLIAYALLYEFLGFTVATGLVVFGFTRLLGVGILAGGVSAIAIALVCGLLLILGLGLPLPLGDAWIW